MKNWKDLAPPVSHYFDPTQFLAALYKAAKLDDPSYTYLRFAEDMGFSHSNVLHLVIRGSRPLTPKASEKICEALGLKGLSRRFWLNMVTYHASRDETEREQLMMEMLEIKAREIERSNTLHGQLEFFTEWYHAVIFEMASLDCFTEDAKVLATLLEPKIRPEQARKSLALLESLKLLVRREGKLEQGQANVATPDEIASLAIIRYHQNMIDLGKRSLSTVDGKDRDVTSITFTCTAEIIPQIKSEISRFRKSILALCETGNESDRVYQMNVQLFPVSRLKGMDSK